MQKPDFIETLTELDAGIVANKLSRVVADVALGVVEHGKKGKIVLTLDLDRIATSSQLKIDHKINYIKPTLRGKATEEETTTTPMYVNKNGYLSIAPDTQLDLFPKHNKEMEQA